MGLVSGRRKQARLRDGREQLARSLGFPTLDAHLRARRAEGASIADLQRELDAGYVAIRKDLAAAGLPVKVGGPGPPIAPAAGGGSVAGR